jgi:putative protease
VHGALPLMVSEYCAAGSLLGGGKPGRCPGPCRGARCGLKDRKGVVFPVELDQYCRMHIFNSRDLCLIEDAAMIAGTGIAALRIEARREGQGYVRDVVKAYRTAWIARLCRRYSFRAQKSCSTQPQGFQGPLLRGVM